MLKTFQSRILNMGRQAYRLKERFIEQLAHKNYYTARAHYHYKLHRSDIKYHHKPPLVVYQMGKVGSSTVSRSLKAANTGRHIYQAHFLTPGLIDKYEKKRRNYLGTDREGDLKHIWQYQHLNKQLKRGLNGQRWKIVTLVRDPVARNLSTFFEHIELLPSATAQQWKLKSIEYDFEMTITNHNLDELIRLFFERCEHDNPLTFFDQEFKPVFNIDLFATDFPIAQGYKIYEAQQVDILLIRLENLNRCAAQAFKEFLDIDNLTIKSHNIGSEKDYADIYQMFKDSIVLPPSYIDWMYSSKFTRHFYSPAEIERFRAKWSRKDPIPKVMQKA